MPLLEYVAIALNRLPIGQKVRHAILDKHMQVLVAAEAELTADVVGKLQYHRIRAYIHRDDREAWGLASLGGPVLEGPATEAAPIYLTFPKHLPAVMPGLLQFVQERVCALAANGGVDGKFEFRYSVALPVPIQAMDKNFHPIDEPFLTVLRDLSPATVGLVSARAPRTDHIAIQMALPTKPPFQLFCVVQRCEAVGRYYDLTCRIQTRLTPETATTPASETAAGVSSLPVPSSL